MRSMRKKSFGPRVEAASNRYTWKIKNPSSVLTFLEAKYLQGGISEGTSSFGRSTERVKGLIGNVPLFSCRNLARAACRPKWCEPRLHHSHREKKKIFQITGCWRGTKKKNIKKNCAAWLWVCFYARWIKPPPGRRTCQTGELSQELFFFPTLLMHVVSKVN